MARIRSTKFDSAEDCPAVETHTAGPSNYAHWHEWAHRMAKTHRQERCEACGFWAVWVPRGAK